MNKDELDAALALANFRKDIRESRIQREWRVSLALWVAIAAAAIAFRGLLADRGCPIGLTILLWTLALICLGGHVAWIVFNFNSNNADAERMYAHLKRAERVLDGEQCTFQEENSTSKVRPLHHHVPAFLQGLATAILLMIAAVLIYLPD